MNSNFDPSAQAGLPVAIAPLPDLVQGRAKRIRILLIIPTLDRGGAEVDVFRILPRIDPKFEFLIFTFLRRGALARQLEEAGIEIVGPLTAIQPRWLLKLGRRSTRIASNLRSLLLYPFVFALPKSVRRKVRNFWRTCRNAIRVFASRTISRTKDVARHLPASIVRALGACFTWPAHVMIGITLAPFIRIREVDIIHTILPNSYIVGSIANSFVGRPLIMSRVSLGWYQQVDPLYRLVERKLLHTKTIAAVCNCNEILSELRDEGFPGYKLHLIPNGIDVYDFSSRMIGKAAARRSLSMSRQAIVLSVVANFHEYKGHADILRALSLVQEQMPEWDLVFIGRDVNGYRGSLERLCHQLSIARRVHFLGEREDVPAILSAADIHVSGSHTEGLPNNIIEAMCAGLPVVATSVGGTSELVLHQKTGLLVPARDPIAMGQAILRLSRDVRLRRSMGDATRKHVEAHFSIDRNVAAFERLYAEIAAAHPHPGLAKLQGFAAASARPRQNGKFRSKLPAAFQKGKNALGVGANALGRTAATLRSAGHLVSSAPTSLSRTLQASPAATLQNALIERRARARRNVPFDFAFHDLTIARSACYRPKPLRVLMIVPTFGRGGAERMMLATSAALARRGYQVRMLALRELLPDEPHILNEIALHRLDHRAGRDSEPSFWEWWRRFNGRLKSYATVLPAWHYNWAAEIAVCIQDFRPAIVHAWLDQPILIAGPVSCLMGVPHFVGSQNNAVSKEIRALFDPYVTGYRALANHPNVTLTNCGAAVTAEYERWLGLPEGWIKVLPNMYWPERSAPPLPEEALAYRRELGIPDDSPVVGAVMRLVDVKDPHLWLASAAEIARLRPDIRFVLAGSGELANSLSEHVRRSGLSGRVVLPGHVSDAQLIYAISDVVMLTSRSEGSPLVLIEAQSSGRPVVGPDVGAIRDTVIDGVTAQIVADRSASAFAEAVLKILGDSEWRGRAAATGPAFVADRFGCERVVDYTLALYERRNLHLRVNPHVGLNG